MEVSRMIDGALLSAEQVKTLRARGIATVEAFVRICRGQAEIAGILGISIEELDRLIAQAGVLGGLTGLESPKVLPWPPGILPTPAQAEQADLSDVDPEA